MLLGEVGRGGMGTVHRAHDEVLDRTVAIKLLHAHLASDETFLERFRREARAAAALTHPNVVAVFDWGESPEGAFLVLQLVEGPTFRTVLRRASPLSAVDAAAVLVPAARGLGAAHRVGLVHRDVKPENLLLGADGNVRITDFGLARAVASATTTFGTDVLVGSPHYLSPEAVQGRPLDPRADVYGLGVILFECLTGRPPHDADTPYATALAHTSQVVPAPSSLVGGLDPALDDVVGWATAIDPAHRYVDALDFARALTNAVGEPAGIDHLVEDPDIGGPTTVMTAAGSVIASPDATSVVEDDLAVEETTPTTAMAPPKRGRRRGAFVTLAVLMLVLASALGGYLLWDRVFAPVVDVPDIVGSDEAAARAALEAAGFDVAVGEPRHDASIEEGLVVTVDPSTQARTGSTVTIALSAGPRPIEIDELFGQTLAAATDRLTQSGVTVDVVEEFDDMVPEGVVVTTRPPAGTIVYEGDRVEIVVSRGPAPIEVPDVVGMTTGEAESVLGALGLNVAVTGQRENMASEGTIIEQQPSPGSDAAGGEVIEVVVSSGPPTVEVPSVRGERVADAVATLEALGLEVDVERRGGVGAFLNPGRVFDQDPGPGSTRRAGETVLLFAYEG